MGRFYVTEVTLVDLAYLGHSRIGCLHAKVCQLLKNALEKLIGNVGRLHVGPTRQSLPSLRIRLALMDRDFDDLCKCF